MTAIGNMQRINGQTVTRGGDARVQNGQTGQRASPRQAGKQARMVLADNGDFRTIAQLIAMHFQRHRLARHFHSRNHIGMAQLRLGREAEPISVGLAAHIGV